MSTEQETPVAETSAPSANNDLNIWGSSGTYSPPVQETIPTPVVEEKTIAAPEKTDIKSEPVVQEKIVEIEKIVEKYPEFKDDYSKQLFEAIQNGRENELFDYLSRKNKDYQIMSDIDVVKENLKITNPSWTDKDIANEIKFKYGNIPAKKDLSQFDQVDDSEEYEKAYQFNEDVDHKELLLSRDARDSRIALENTKKTIEFPKIEQKVAEQPTGPTQEQLDEEQRQWEAKVDLEMPKLSDFKFKIGDEEITYKITDQDKANQISYMKNFTPEGLAQELGWVDANGDYNISKLAEDVLKLKSIDKIIASSATQMKTTATKEVIAEIKNVDLSQKSSSPELSQKSLGEILWR